MGGDDFVTVDNEDWMSVNGILLRERGLIWWHFVCCDFLDTQKIINLSGSSVIVDHEIWLAYSIRIDFKFPDKKYG